MSTPDDLLSAFADTLEFNDLDREPEDERPKLVAELVKEFRCLSCGEPFSRKDCGNDQKGMMASIKRCPRCRSELIVRQVESGWAANRKYDVSIEDSILGQKPGKYAGLAAKKAILSGKIKRKKA
jgi:DNA-directed RNA polymerase subunit RPC12/RpoP